ncbi:NADPH:quinone oxidoreductase family protein [Blastococcus sp. Marseille-P5729]|uniref:NADPH:quinone oxidoreductase family protein n=1 Tax=Blastococcus sp. Marseille-P5729 TaxID=2086582 RepID=UPI000D0E46A7|nr:NADPH:quinone oxidoreductase family protein [Blastococcus sp. Marseille-P5729]
MRTWHVTRLGEPPSVIEQVDIPEPEPADGEVLLEVEAVSVGFPDWLMAQGLYHDKPDLPFGLGGESSARVLRAPAGSGLTEGQRVIALAGGKGGITLTSRIAATPDRLLPVPDKMSPEHAAVLFVAYQTAYVGLMRRGRLQVGETVVVHGASGGVGMAAVQIAKASGARVIAVAGGEQKAQACREFGADVVIDHRTDDFVEVVKELTGGRGVDVVFDPVGGDTFDRSRRIMAVEGRLVVVGFAGGTIAQAPTNHALLKNYDVVGFRMRPFREDRAYRRRVHDSLVQMYQAGALHPRVTTYDFDDLPAALELIGSRQVIGRVVVYPPT